MAWTTPRTWVAGELVTASIMNTHVRDNENALLGPFQLYISATGMRPDLTNGCDFETDATTSAGNPLVSGLGFSGSADQYAQFAIPLPKAWNASTITFRAHWTSPNAGSGSVVWSLQAVAVSDDDTINASFGTAQNVTDAFITTNDHHLSASSSAITIAGTPAKQDCIYFRLGRLATNGSDTKAEKVYLIGIEVFVTNDTVNDA